MKVLKPRFLLVALTMILLIPAVSWGQAASDTLLSGKIRVVPNPWSANTAAPQYAGPTRNSVSDTKSGYTRVVFFNLPPHCTIKIFSLDGDRIRTLSYPDPDSNYWNLISDSNQYVASGVYVFVVEAPNGDAEVGKFIIIR